MDRRDFIGQATAAAGIVAAQQHVRATQTAANAQSAAGGVETREGVPYRSLGKTGEKVSAIGLGGHHIGQPKDPQEGIRLIRSAIDRGINFMDNCWDYHEGESERRMGDALRDGYRQKVFLMTKIDGRTKQAAAQQIDESLKRLQTDRVDLMQIHEVIRLEDPDMAFAPGGSIEALREAKQAGKIRFVGFTGHKDPLVHLRMLETAARHDFRFDAVQMPLNVMDAHFRSFEKQVLPVLVRDQVGVLGMKSMGGGAIVRNKAATPAECLRYALSLPTSTVISGMQNMELLDQNIEAARTFKPMSREEVSGLLARTADAARNGQHELFKTSARFDGTARNPHWLG